VNYLRLKGDVPNTFAKEFTHGFSNLCACFEGMLRIRYEYPNMNLLIVGILQLHCVIVFIRERILDISILIMQQTSYGHVLFCPSFLSGIFPLFHLF